MVSLASGPEFKEHLDTDLDSFEILPRERVVDLAALSLNCSRSDATRVVAASDESRRRTLQNWSDATRLPVSYAIERSTSISIPDMPRLKQITGQDSKGLVLSGIHMGDYLHALLRILLEHKSRKILICRKRSESKEESTIVRRLAGLGIDSMIVRTRAQSPLRLVRALRRGAIVITFHDLSFRWGPVANVNIFKRRGQIVRGPATLAVLGEARLVPFATIETEEGSICSMGDALSCDLAKQKQASIEAATQFLATHTEAAVRAAPHQWLHWPVANDILGTTTDCRV